MASPQQGKTYLDFNICGFGPLHICSKMGAKKRKKKYPFSLGMHLISEPINSLRSKVRKNNYHCSQYRSPDSSCHASNKISRREAEVRRWWSAALEALEQLHHSEWTSGTLPTLTSIPQKHQTVTAGRKHPYRQTPSHRHAPHFYRCGLYIFHVKIPPAAVRGRGLAFTMRSDKSREKYRKKRVNESVA